MTAALEGTASLARAAAAWAGTHRVDVGRWRMRFHQAGEGPPIVLVHGLGVSADYWYRNGPPLAAAGFRVLAPDLPGFGRTEGPPGGLPVRSQAAALLAWARALELGPAVYVGHSLSCQTALELAVAAPEAARGLVLASPTGAPHGHRLLRQGWGFLLDVPREDPRLVPVVAQAYLRAGPLRVFRTWRQGAEHDPLPLLPCVKVPARVVVGVRDPVVSPDFAETLARGLPGEGRVVWIEGAAHAVHFSGADAFNRAILEFAAGL